ncbi:cell division protein FtsA [Buchnera aphidicola (Ceratovacuna keduensis)]|uniref:cell division protein FtsA n=1 Tax=Buchnera aphidicola TaxID=9 RepID=UPI0031B89B09
MEKKLVTSIEIGHNKIVTLIGEIYNNNIKIIGIGKNESKGINKTGIYDLESIKHCIEKSINKAEIMSKKKIKSAYLSISHEKIKCHNEIGIIPVSGKEIQKQDIKNVIYSAKSIKINDEHIMLHVIPQEYSIDKRSGIKNPIGLSGMRMKGKVHLITCHKEIYKNIKKSIEKCKIKVKKLIFSGIASSEAVLTKEEKKFGVCMIDIGSNSIDLSIYYNGYTIYNHVIPYASELVTNDIAYAFSISYKKAEKIKINHGCTTVPILEKIKNNNILDSNGKIIKNITIQRLIDVIEPRYIELLNIVKQKIIKIQKKIYKYTGKEIEIKRGIVITGGGSKIKFLKNCAKKIFLTKVRIAIPKNIKDKNKKIYDPIYSTSVGILKYVKKNNKFKKKKKNNNFIKNIFEKINKWIIK